MDKKQNLFFYFMGGVDTVLQEDNTEDNAEDNISFFF